MVNPISSVNAVSAVKTAARTAMSGDTASVIGQQAGATKAKSSGVTVSLSALSKFISAPKAPPTTNTVGDAIAAYTAAVKAGTVSSLSAFTIKDAVSALTAGTNLADLSAMAAAGKIAGISLTDAKPALTFKRSDLLGDISDAKSTNGTVLLLQKITSNFTLNLTSVGAADALTIKTPSKAATLQISVVDTAAAISSNLDNLEAVAKAKNLKDITLTDPRSALFNVSEAQFKSDADALKLVQGSYILEATGVAAASVSKIASTANLAGIDVVDSAKNVIANLSALKASASALKLISVTLNDTTNPVISTADATSLNSLPSLAFGKGIKLNIADTANNIIESARFDPNNFVANAGSVSLTDKTTPVLTLADAKTLTGISNLASGTKYAIADGGNAITTQAKIINEKVLSGATNIQLVKAFSIADAKVVTGLKSLDKATAYSITDTAANILTQSAVKGETILSKAVTVNISDTSANIAANLDKLETLAKAGQIDNITISDANPTGYFGVSADKVTVDQDVLGKILAQIITTPSSSAKISPASNSFVATNGTNYYLMPRAGRSNGDLLWATETISPSANPRWDNPKINTFDVSLTPQNKIGIVGYNAGVPAGTVSAQGLPGGTVIPLLFAQDPASRISSGGVVKFNQTDGSWGPVKTYSVTWTPLTMTGSTAPSQTISPSQMAVNVSATSVDLLSNIKLDQSKAESYTWSNDQSGFTIAWSKQTSVDDKGNGTYAINVANFGVDGKQIGATNILSNAYILSASDINNGNGYTWDALDNNHLIVSDGNGGVKIQSIDTGVSTKSFVPDLDPGSYSFVGNYTGLINPDQTGNANSIILAFSGTKGGKNVVEYYSVNSSTMTQIGQSGPINTSSLISNIRGGLTLPDNSSAVFGYQDGTSLHTQLIDGLGHLVSDKVTTLPMGVKFDRYKPLSDGLFAAVWRSPGSVNGTNEIVGQIFDSRGASVSITGSSAHPAVIAGTASNDTINVVTSGSLVEGGAGADTLTATARAYNSTLSYNSSSSAVTVDLAKNTTSGGDATGDKISGFINLIGSNYSDTLTGTANGYVYGGGGNDTIIGDGKTTTALYSGNYSDYSVKNDAQGRLIITDLRTGSPDNVDTLISVANLKFADRTLSVSDLVSVV